MKRYKITAGECSAWHRDFPGELIISESKDGEWVLWDFVEKMLQHLNQDKDGDFFLTKESYKEIFDNNK